MAKVENIVEEPIMEFFNKNSFMKVKPDGFRIGRLLLSFGNMDDNKKLVPGWISERRELIMRIT